MVSDIAVILSGSYLTHIRTWQNGAYNVRDHRFGTLSDVSASYGSL